MAHAVVGCGGSEFGSGADQSDAGTGGRSRGKAAKPLPAIDRVGRDSLVGGLKFEELCANAGASEREGSPC